MYIGYVQEIDGLTIITGVDKKGIEPIETEKIIQPLLLESSEMIARKSNIDKIRVFETNKQTINGAALKLLESISIDKNIKIVNITDKDFTLQQKNLSIELQNGINFNNSQINELKNEIPGLNENLKLKKIQLIKDNAVYQETGENQIDLNETQYLDFQIKLVDIRSYCNSTKKRRFLISSGDVIDDNRGRIVWIKNVKWEKRTLQFLVDLKGTLEIWEDELTEEQQGEIIIQIEIDRMEALTPEEKEAEKIMMLDAALKQSVQMRNELEIQGDPDALQKAQDWYNAEVVKIEEKYS